MIFLPKDFTELNTFTCQAIGDRTTKALGWYHLDVVTHRLPEQWGNCYSLDYECVLGLGQRET